MKQYEDRLIAWIDILGFADLVDNKSCDEISNILDEFIKGFEISKGPNIIYKKQSGAKGIKEKLKIGSVIQFSDTIIWTFPVYDEASFYNKFKDFVIVLDIFQRHCLRSGILIRGSITKGKIFRDNSKWFGPGIVDSYRLEKQAKVPRIIIDSRLIKNYPKIENLVALGHLESQDNVCYLSHFGLTKRHFIAMSKGEDYGGVKDLITQFHFEIIESCQNLIIKGLSHPDPCVVGKYLWLKQGYEKVCYSILQIPDLQLSQDQRNILLKVL